MVVRVRSRVERFHIRKSSVDSQHCVRAQVMMHIAPLCEYPSLELKLYRLFALTARRCRYFRRGRASHDVFEIGFDEQYAHRRHLIVYWRTPLCHLSSFVHWFEDINKTTSLFAATCRVSRSIHTVVDTRDSSIRIDTKHSITRSYDSLEICSSLIPHQNEVKADVPPQ